MAETENSNASLQSLHAALDPKSLILSQFPHFLHLQTDSFIMERGPRYEEYSALRNKRLRMKTFSSSPDDDHRHTPHQETPHNRSVLTPPRKQVKFSSNLTTTPPRRSGKPPPSVLAQSTPDFSSALRKENRRPSVTPPPGLMKSGKMYGKVGIGTKSTSSVEKRSGGVIRKSYANMEELKGISVGVGDRIVNAADNRGGRVRRSVLGNRQL